MNIVYTYVVGWRVWRLREPADPQHFGGLQERTQVPLVNVYFAMINKLDQRLQVVEHDVLQYNYRVFAWRALCKSNITFGFNSINVI